MSVLLELRNFSLSVGTTQLIDSANARLVQGQRVALVGHNGAGKSTLLRALAQHDNGDCYFTVNSGEIIRNRHLSDSSILQVEQDVRQWKRLLGGDEEGDVIELPLCDALDLQVAEGTIDTEDAESWRRISVAAHDGLGWRTARYNDTPISQLSPGCGARAYLAVALKRPDIDVLLLDEPTNHLDLPSILWLEEAIISSGKTCVIVSHDGTFLDKVCDHIWHIDAHDQSLSVSISSYSDYRRAEQLARQQQIIAYEVQQKRNKKLTAVADKLRDASTKGQSAVAKDNDKMQRDFRRDRAGRSGKKAKSIESFRDRQEAVQKVMDRPPLKIDIVPLGAGANGSIILSDVVLGYDEILLPTAPVISTRIDFGEHVAIVGFNGVGKSTLLRTITKMIPPISGAVTVGTELRIGNLTQEHDNLRGEQSLRQHFAALSGFTAFKAGQFLMRYGLKRTQLDIPVEELNPGARARALLAGFAMRQVNLLILDEPTNHLDVEAINEVTRTVNCFDGTVVAVSHNREFLAALENQRILRLSVDGLQEVETLDEVVGEIDEAVAKVMRDW